jgi:hypothetical protein
MPTCSSTGSGNAVSIPDCSLSPVRLPRAPVIEQYENERQVEYVFDAKSYQQWIEKGEEPLRSASILALQFGDHAGRNAESRKRLRVHPLASR